MKQIKIFDTTLRDGEQSPGCSMNLKEKIEMAKQLERLNVDIIEAGFAASSPGDFLSVKTIWLFLKPKPLWLPKLKLRLRNLNSSIRTV